jgi:DNA-binding CsgD family transcriptional regulator/tetratricopeptide (TPR) repeat protein
VTPLERHRELAAIEEAVRALKDERGSVVLLEGPAGIGKSVLLDEARRRLDDDVRLLGARGGTLERDFGFGVVRQLLELPARSREIPEAARGVLTDLGADSGPPGEGSFAALHGLLWVVLDLAEDRPLLLAVDDLQWADRPSLRFLAYLARRIGDLPVLLLATIRTGEPDADEDLLDAVRQAPAVSLSPAPLSAPAVGSIVASRLGERPEEAFVAACHTATGGNPLLVRELVAGLELDGTRPTARQAGVVRSVGPRAVSRTVAARLARLEPEARATARAVAILGDGVGVGVAARFAGLDEARVAEATGPLARADILQPEPPLAFVHPLVADAVVATLPPGERELQHARAARLLFETRASAEQIAGHLVRAPAQAETWVVGVLREAARTAMQRGAPESAGVFLRRALDEPPPADERAELLLELGLAEALSNGRGAVEHLRGALAALVYPQQRALAAAALGRTLLFTGQAEAGAEVATRVAAEMDEAHGDLRDQLLGFAHMTAWFDERAVGAAEATTALRDRVPRRGATAGPRLVAAATSFAWATEPGPREACVELASAALAEGWLLEIDTGFLFVPPVVVLALAERPEAISHLEEGLARAHRRGSLFAIAGMRLWSAAVRAWRGELEEAEAFARQAREDLRLWGFDAQWLHDAFLMTPLVRRGDLAAARALLEAAEEPDPPTEGARHFHQAKLELLAAEGRDEEALAAADVLERGFGHMRNPATATWRSLRAPARHRAGDVDGALADLAEELELAQAWGAPGPIGRVQRIRGELLGDIGQLREAVAILAGSTVRLEYAHALLALGRRLRLDRRPTEAREPLREALAVAAACGAQGLVDDVRAELGAAGARPRTDALAGPRALTPSERRIAELAAGGLTNRDIAQQLFVTPKTVEVHLSAVYRKLGIASRRGLPSAMAVA